MAAQTPLEELGYPLAFRVDDSGAFDAPGPRLDQAQRTRIRSLSDMQKEALVTSSRSGETWRMASDEGPYLGGADIAPPPLAFMTTGMVCSFAEQVQTVARDRALELRDLTLVQDNFYAIRGSALRGDMTGSALSPTLEVRVEADAHEETVHEVVADGVASAPITGLLNGVHESRFTLTHNGDALGTERVHEFDGPRLDDPRSAFERLSRDGQASDLPAIRHTGRTTEEFQGDREKYSSGSGVGFEAEQDRVIHLRGICRRRDDGLLHVEQKLYSPRGSVFEFLADEPAGHGGQGRAPDALTYVAAGLGFCFMTQFGRYADIVDKPLSDYRIVQDTNFAAGDLDAGTPPAAESAQSHVFLDTPEGPEFARTVLDMSEQTCYLHALCRTDLDPTIEVELTSG